MSDPHLPVELLDHIVDLLYDTEDALMNCCLVSKSWAPRTRKHLFANVKVRSAHHLKSWRETFPDPSTSPARYAKTLSVSCPRAVTAADAESGGWITGFCSVVHLEVIDHKPSMMATDEPTISFAPFHGFSPIIKSLRVAFFIIPSSQVFDFILSFPLLEDLAVVAYRGSSESVRDSDGSDGLSAMVQPSNPPAFTGSLDLFMRQGMKSVAYRLLSLQSGIHFQKLTLRWFREEDLLLTTALVEGCASTLKSLDIVHDPSCTSSHTCVCARGSLLFLGKTRTITIDLSKATKLRDVVLRSGSSNVEWITVTLQTIAPAHQDLRRITIHASNGFSCFSPDFVQIPAEEIRGQWPDLDRVLVRLWESHSIRPRVVHAILEGQGREWCMRMKDCIKSSLSEIGREIIDLVDD